MSSADLSLDGGAINCSSHNKSVYSFALTKHFLESDLSKSSNVSSHYKFSCYDWCLVIGICGNICFSIASWFLLALAKVCAKDEFEPAIGEGGPFLNGSWLHRSNLKFYFPSGLLGLKFITVIIIRNSQQILIRLITKKKKALNKDFRRKHHLSNSKF